VERTYRGRVHCKWSCTTIQTQAYCSFSWYMSSRFVNMLRLLPEEEGRIRNQGSRGQPRGNSPASLIAYIQTVTPPPLTYMSDNKVYITDLYHVFTSVLGGSTSLNMLELCSTIRVLYSASICAFCRFVPAIPIH